MSKINLIKDALLQTSQLRVDLKHLSEEKMDATDALDRIEELEHEITKLEGIIAGYAVAFNSTLNQYKAFVTDEVKQIALSSLQSATVNKVVNDSIEQLSQLIATHLHSKVTDHSLLAHSIDSVIDSLKYDLKAVQSNANTPIEIKPIRDNEHLHASFNKLLTCVHAGIIPMLVGPAGTGKSTAVEQLARSLGLRFFTANRVQNAFELTGYNDAAGKYVPTQFFEAYKNGGVFFFDEVDASAPEALVTINTAIAQGYMSFPGFNYPVSMHSDFKMVAAGNTFGNGASREYCGRNALDAATLDRFMIIEWEYDKKLESKIIDDTFLLNFCWGIRDVINSSRIHIIISTRGILATYKVLKLGTANFSVSEVLQGNLFEGLGRDTVTKIIGGLDSLDKGNAGRVQSHLLYANNPYYLATKTLLNSLK